MVVTYHLKLFHKEADGHNRILMSPSSPRENNTICYCRRCRWSYSVFDLNTLFKWFGHNLSKGNADKCHLLLDVKDAVSMKTGDFNIVNNNKCAKLLGVKFDYKLTFNSHVSNLCKNASRKINALTRVALYMSISKRRILMNPFFKSEFNYCLLVWMCQSRINNTKINRLHERCLRMIYNDQTSSFETF